MKVIVRIPEAEDDRKKSWRKELTGVDKNQSNGYAFMGNWLKGGEKAELDLGSFVLTYDEPGSMKYWKPHVRLYKVSAVGLENVFDWEGEYQEKSWALSVRDKIADIIEDNELTEDELTEDEKAIVEKLRSISSERLQLILKTLKEYK